eukprot:scaffold30790_cov63-Phaeocystis_antarctica.AAC.1
MCPPALAAWLAMSWRLINADVTPFGSAPECSPEARFAPHVGPWCWGARADGRCDWAARAVRAAAAAAAEARVRSRSTSSRLRGPGRAAAIAASAAAAAAAAAAIAAPTAAEAAAA